MLDIVGASAAGAGCGVALPHLGVEQCAVRKRCESGASLDIGLKKPLS